MHVFVNVSECIQWDVGGGEGFDGTADDRSCTACLLIIATAGG